MIFYDTLPRLRKAKGFSQEKLAEKIGVSRQAIAKWEAGLSQPDIDKLIVLSTIFRTSIDSLVKAAETSCATAQTIPQQYFDEELTEFLCRAKQATYAGHGPQSPATRPQSHDLTYQEGDLTYRDSYLGSEQFAGEEALWCKDVPFWAMNYLGRVLGSPFSGSFLKEALSHVPPEAPYRGPSLYQNGDYVYHCRVDGDFRWFNGTEEIFFQTKKIYECRFHGGWIK